MAKFKKGDRIFIYYNGFYSTDFTDALNGKKGTILDDNNPIPDVKLDQPYKGETVIAFEEKNLRPLIYNRQNTATDDDI
ncbi:hypothetical protein [Pedobacter antarcticus]|uniref:hypothetical protein n=1 Tax=Pedobacter antarcticus TaxID=34086 RepID=UPI00292D6BC8|nr:hypothetical protein [Pedobacter antarcticus]